MNILSACKSACLVALALVGSQTAGHAQSVEEFYKGKTVTLVISAAAGGASDMFGRAFAAHFGKHIPGQPKVVITNQAGAGGITAAARLQTMTPRDGTVVAMLQRNNLYLPLVEGIGDRFDPRKVDWLGSLNKEIYYVYAWKGQAVQTPEDMWLKPLRLGATAFAHENRTIPAMMNQYLGTKFEIIQGYAGSDEVGLAMERGEVNGKLGTLNNLMAGGEGEWLRQGKIKIIVQAGLTAHPGLS